MYISRFTIFANSCSCPDINPETTTELQCVTRWSCVQQYSPHTDSVLFEARGESRHQWGFGSQHALHFTTVLELSHGAKCVQFPTPGAKYERSVKKHLQMYLEARKDRRVAARKARPRRMCTLKWWRAAAEWRLAWPSPAINYKLDITFFSALNLYMWKIRSSLSNVASSKHYWTTSIQISVLHQSHFRWNIIYVLYKKFLLLIEASI